VELLFVVENLHVKWVICFIFENLCKLQGSL